MKTHICNQNQTKKNSYAINGATYTTRKIIFSAAANLHRKTTPFIYLFPMSLLSTERCFMVEKDFKVQSYIRVLNEFANYKPEIS